MCHEYRGFRHMQSGEEEAKAKQHARERIEKARSAWPAPPASEPVTTRKEIETVPA